jgi:hypothetical protein
MQLPLGSVESLKSGIVLSSLFKELKKSGFTGLSRISIDDETASLVLEKGEPVLVECPPYKGKSALKKLQALNARRVDAELYSLTKNQIKLCFKVNSEYRLIKGNGTPYTSSTTLTPDKRTVEVHHPLSTTSSALVQPEITLNEIQLPRGIFHSQRLEITLSSLLDELKNGRFTGYCFSEVENVLVTVVLDGGICLLADYPPDKGSNALQVLQMKVDNTIDAELYSLTPAQMKLALEFNREYRVGMSAKPVVLHMKPQKIPERSLKKRMKAKKKEQESQDFDEQMRAIEEMNLNEMTDDFKDAFKDVIYRLDLDHLMENDDTPDSNEE